eukprot:scaffold3806_cov94-Isochrysis_galbana.AAC.1
MRAVAGCRGKALLEPHERGERCGRNCPVHKRTNLPRKRKRTEDDPGVQRRQGGGIAGDRVLDDDELHAKMELKWEAGVGGMGARGGGGD